MRPSVREQAGTREKDEALRETGSGAETREASGVERLGGALARVGLALSACMLGVVLLVVCFSTARGGHVCVPARRHPRAAGA